jgi:hypothetical protein
MHGAAALFRRAVAVGATKSIRFENKKKYSVKFENSLKKC